MTHALPRLATAAVLVLLTTAGASNGQWIYGEGTQAAPGTDDTAAAHAPDARLDGDPIVYAHDTGSGNVNIGPPSTFDPDMLWGNYYLTQPGGEVITHILVAFGPTFPSLGDGPVTFWVLDDPDMDFDPRNAISLLSVQGEPDVFGNTFFEVEIPPTEVSGAFFVGASAQLLGGQDRPARVDTNGPPETSWFFYAPDISEVIDDLASAPFGTSMDNPEFVPFPGAFMVRAVGIPADDPVSSSDGGIPIAFGVEQNYPNPFSGRATIRYALAEAGPVRITVYDLAGRRVAMLVDAEQEAGRHAVTWDAAGLATGVYFYRMRAGTFIGNRRAVIVR